jgi:hypothetical protein
MGPPSVNHVTAPAGAIGSLADIGAIEEELSSEPRHEGVSAATARDLAMEPAIATRQEDASASLQGGQGEATTFVPKPSPLALLAASTDRSKAHSPDSPVVDHSPFASLAAESSSRRNLHSLKVLSRLVSAIARRPGSSAPDALKAQQLSQLIQQVKAAADRLASSITPLDAHRGWIKANAMEAAAHLVASQWEADAHGEATPLAVQLDALEAVFDQAHHDEALDAALDQLGQSAYVEAVTNEVAADRVELSTRLAAWDLHGHVTNPLLGQGAYRFTYGRKAPQIIGLLVPHVLSMAREMQMRTSNLEVATAHLQSCIRRAAELLGSEYVARTRALMNWIAQDGISDEEYRQRHELSCQSFEQRIVPAVVDSAKASFQAIESMASRGLEDMHVEQSHKPPRNH